MSNDINQNETHNQLGSTITQAPTGQQFGSLAELEKSLTNTGSQIPYESTDITTSDKEVAVQTTPQDSSSEFELPADTFNGVINSQDTVVTTGALTGDSALKVAETNISSTTTITPVPAEVKQEKAEEEMEVSTLEDAYAEELAKETRTEMVNVLLDALEDYRAKNSPQLTQKANIQNALANLPRADVNAISVVHSSANPLETEKQLNVIRQADVSPATPVIALKSGYRASLSSMTNSEKLALRNLSGTPYDQTLKIVNLIHRKITESSVGRMDFKQFIRNTAEDDYETLVYGIYNSTYPEAVEYRLTCPHCNTTLNVKVQAKNLLQVLDVATTGEYVQKLINGVEKGEDFTKDALVNNTSRTELDKSRIIFEFRTPSLEMMLRNQQDMARLSKQYEADMVGLLRFISGVYVPNLANYKGGAVNYTHITDMAEILSILNTLSSPDIHQVRKAISQRNNQYRVDYRIPTITCSESACRKTIEKASIDMTQLLFTGIVAETAV